LRDKSRAELLEILNMLLEEDLAWFELRTPSAYIRIGNGPQVLNPAPPTPAVTGDGQVAAGRQTPVASANAASAENHGVAQAPARAAVPSPEAQPEEAALSTGPGHPVTAPFAGVFYRRPSPTEPPFVEVGSRVRATDTVCLVEVMKLFNSVHAGVDGVVTAIEVGDGEVVEYGQVLMRIAPEGS